MFTHTNLKYRFYLGFYRAGIFILILAFVFSPIGDLAYKYLPKDVADQIAQVSPRIPTASAHTDDILVFITVASNSDLSNSWTVPLDWNSASNSIEVIGGGGGGGDGNASGPGGAGGGGYSRINNLSLTRGSTVTFSVGAGGATGGANSRGSKGGKTYFNAVSFAGCTDNAVCVKADGGEGSFGNASTTGAIGGQISTTASAVGTVTYTGGNGGTGCGGDGGGGGGGAGGPKGNGQNGGNGGGDASPGLGGGGGGNSGGSAGSNASVSCASATSGTGGTGGDNAYDANSGGTENNAGTNGGGGGGGADGADGGAGGSGDEWATGYGSGGGGGGGGDGQDGGNGGGFGGGAGGGENNSAGGKGDGSDGVIVIKYTPLAVQSHFQWFNDDYALDSMDNLASISAEDIKASGSEALAINDISRVRFQIANLDNWGTNANFTTDKFRLEMTRAGTSCINGAISAGWTWRTVPTAAVTASDAFDLEDSSQFTDGASTSVQLLSTPTGAATFTSGYGLDSRATSGFQTINDNYFTEIEWAIKPNANANTSADYCFRVGWITDASTTPDTRASVSFSKIASASVQAALSTTFTQNDYQWWYNVNDIDPAGSIAGENTSGEVLSTQPVRLRINLTIGASNLSAGSVAFKLKYSTSASGPWSDVGSITSGETWRYYDNPGVTDGTTLTSNKLGASDVSQTYQESNPSGTNPNTATTTQDIEYDFALDPTRADPGSTYYFRMFKSNDDSLTAYSTDPTITIQALEKPGGGHAGGGGGISVDSYGGGVAVHGGGSGHGEGGCADPPCGGGGQAQSGGESGGGGGGGSPVMFDWRLWFDRWLLGLNLDK